MNSLDSFYAMFSKGINLYTRVCFAVYQIAFKKGYTLTKLMAQEVNPAKCPPLQVYSP